LEERSRLENMFRKLRRRMEAASKPVLESKMGRGGCKDREGGNAPGSCSLLGSGTSHVQHPDSGTTCHLSRPLVQNFCTKNENLILLAP
jgi:hypothetical protein